MRFSFELPVRAPREEVFDFLGDPALRTTWQTSIVKFEMEPQGEPRVGVKWRETVKGPAAAIGSFSHIRRLGSATGRAAGGRREVRPLLSRSPRTPLWESRRTSIVASRRTTDYAVWYTTSRLRWGRRSGRDPTGAKEQKPCFA